MSPVDEPGTDEPNGPTGDPASVHTPDPATGQAARDAAAGAAATRRASGYPTAPGPAAGYPTTPLPVPGEPPAGHALLSGPPLLAQQDQAPTDVYPTSRFEPGRYGPAAAAAAPRPSGVPLDRIVLGLLLAAGGIGWLLDSTGVSVPWRMFPAAALGLVGLALLVSLAGGRGRGSLIGWGIPLLVVAVAAGIGAGQYAGPVGDQVIIPAANAWPVDVRSSAGSVTVDLTRNPLPESGSLSVSVGAGQVELLLPEEVRPRLDASIVAGSLTVDGAQVTDGLDIRWSEPSPNRRSVTLTVNVGLGEIVVRHG